MNIKQYKARLAKDLERWIGAGWVPDASRELILADIPDEGTSRATLWLGMIGAVLAGLAIVAGIADNWAIVPRALKLGVLLGGFWVALGAAVWADRSDRQHVRNATTMIAALIFAASIGLLGQALNIPGDASTLFLLSALGAAVLAIGGSSSAAGIVYLVMAGLWYWTQGDFFDNFVEHLRPSDAIAGGFLLGGFALAATMRSRVVLHATLASAGPFLFVLALRLFKFHEGAYLLFAFWAVLATGSLALLRHAGARTIFGWSVWHGLIAFGLAGFDMNHELAHRGAWIALSIAVIAIAARISQGWAIGGGVVSLIGATFITLIDLGMSLGTASALFGLAALIVLAVALVLQRRSKGASS